MNTRAVRRCPCGGDQFSIVHTYTAAPEGETNFPSSSEHYQRDIQRCDRCGHFLSSHEMNLDGFYGKTYVDASYGRDGIREAFDRIISLDAAKSDNVQRVRRILSFADTHFIGSKRRSVLDVGSGLCVFLHRMQAEGWDCTAVDPDERAARHAESVVGVTAVCGDFMLLQDLGRFDVVVFNKVLEHVENPVEMLSRALVHVNPESVVYVELPDGESAACEGFHREEFFIEHLHVFSKASVVRLGERAGFTVIGVERLREPSSKYTLRAFLVPSVSDTIKR